MGRRAAGIACQRRAEPARGRTALVIGNDRYRHNPLGNAVNDARAMADLLTQAGFAVDLKLNATLEQMTSAIDALGKAVAGPDVGTSLFYYAGHAAQLDWRNYLLPVDGDVESAGDIRKQCVDLGLLLGPARPGQGQDRVDHPRRVPGRSVRRALSAAAKGHEPIRRSAPARCSPSRPRRGASRSRCRAAANGLYTEHLVRELSVKGVRIEDALKRVRLNVRLASNGAQVPWESTSLESDIYLFPTPQLSEAELERQLREEFETWSKIKSSPNPNDWIDYLRRYPNGKFAEVAQVRMRQLTASPVPSPRASRAGPAAGLAARAQSGRCRRGSRARATRTRPARIRSGRSGLPATNTCFTSSTCTATS